MWQIKSTNKTQTTKGETQIPQPDMRFAIQQRNKAKSERGRAQQNQTQPRFAMDTVVKSHCVATHKKMHLVATQKSETRFLIVVADWQQKKALAVHYCNLACVQVHYQSVLLWLSTNWQPCTIITIHLFLRSNVCNDLAGGSHEGVGRKKAI